MTNVPKSIREKTNVYDYEQYFVSKTGILCQKSTFFEKDVNLKKSTFFERGIFETCGIFEKTRNSVSKVDFF